MKQFKIKNKQKMFIKRPVDIKKNLQRIEDCKYSDIDGLEKQPKQHLRKIIIQKTMMMM